MRRHHTVGEFENPDQLAAKVTADLHRWLFEEFLEPKPAQGARGELPRADTEQLLAAIKDWSTINQQLLAKLRSRGLVVAKGERSVAAGTITGSTIVTGDGNTVVQNRGRGGERRRLACFVGPPARRRCAARWWWGGRRGADPGTRGAPHCHTVSTS